ncbi:MAG: mucoidy inhibitor MuiA family protein [Flavobacteriaceae bacterium]
MKKAIFTTVLFPLYFWGAPSQQEITSEIEQVTVYLNGAQVTRNASLILSEGSNEIVFTGLSHKIDESSIQVSGLQHVSILAMAYDINFLEKSKSHPKVSQWESQIITLEHEIAMLKNKIIGLEEEEKVINANRLVSTDGEALTLEKVQQIGRYYRERITAIKDEIFTTYVAINTIKLQVSALQNQLSEVNNAPATQQGEITITFDAPISTSLHVTFTYMVADAGWVPNYDIKSVSLNAPLQMTYKANVYQKTGMDWNDVKVTLSTGNPNYNIAKPHLEAHYLNFTNGYQRRKSAIKKEGYAFNPHVKKVVGIVTDTSGQPLPGANVMVKGTTNGTQSDFDGQYTLEVPHGRELVFSYIGMHSVEVPLYASTMNVTLEEDGAALEEVVVTALGTSQKSNPLGYATGAVASVSPETLVQGRVAGVQIRGTSSLPRTKTNKQTPTPLYIVDGVPLDGFVEGDLDEREIQDIEVVRGVNATTIYGSKGAHGVVIITTRKSSIMEGATKTEFAIKKPYTIVSDGDITAMEINSFKIPAEYEYFAAPIINENVFLTATFKDWEQHQLLPGEATIYFEGSYAGKTVIDPYATAKKEMVLSLGIDPNITVIRERERNFKGKPFVGNNRVINRTYQIEIKNNKNVAVTLKLMDRIPKSQNKEIKVGDIMTHNAVYDAEKGLLTWKLPLKTKETRRETFSFVVKYPKYRSISL